MQSAYHNLPTINGVMQQDGREFAASDVSYNSDDSGATFSLDIAGAYPAGAGVNRWLRTVRLDRRAGQVSLIDEYKLDRREGELALNLLTACRAEPAGEGRIKLSGESDGGRYTVSLEYDPRLNAEVETIELNDRRLESSWGDRLYRIRLIAPADSPLQDKWTLHVSE
jgi:hypothetical protein